MRFDSIVVAEAISADARGALAIIGFNQRVIAAPLFPAIHKFSIAVVLTDETENGFDSGLADDVSIRVIGPGGAVQFTVNQSVSYSNKDWVDLPVLGTIALDVPVIADMPGVYNIEISLIEQGAVVETQLKKLYIFSPVTTLGEAPTFPRRAFQEST